MGVFSGFKRMFLFFLTNILVMITLSITFSLVVSFFGLSQAVSYLPVLAIFALIFGMGGSFISLLMSKFMAKKLMGVEILEPDSTLDSESRWLVGTVHNLARKAQLPKLPEVGVFESETLNAFATGPSRSNSLVAVSTGLLQRMSHEEIEGVLGHEVSHIANGDMVTMTLIQGVVNTFVIFVSRVLSHLIASNVDRKLEGIVYFLSSLVLEIMFTILGSLVVNWFSQQREFRADLGGAKLSSRENMISALRRLQSYAQYMEQEQNTAMASLQIAAKPKSGIAALFSTHPDLELRIERLEKASLHLMR